LLHRSSLALTLALIPMVLVVGPATAAKAADKVAKPTLTIQPATAPVGATVQVVGSGLPSKASFQFQICGQRAVHGSADCASGAAVQVLSESNGTISLPITVVVPPIPCPCVVAAFAISSALTVTTPISIPGAPVSSTPVSPPQLPRSHLVVAKSELAGSTPVAAWFGFPATRTLDLTLTNTGAAPATSIHLIADLGSTPVLNTRLGPLGPRQTKTYEVSVTIPALSVGNMNVNGHIFTGDGQQTSFKVPVTIWPVGLLLVAIVLAQMILLAVRNIMRRRHERRNPTPPTDAFTGELPIVESPPTEQVTPV
jgi:hypothetical protein